MRDPNRLDEIRRLFSSGDNSGALEQLDNYLQEHPDDGEARLLKVEICLEARQSFEFIVQTLDDPTLRAQYADRAAVLDQRRESLGQTLMSDGQSRLARSLGEAVQCFDSALSLLPNDMSIAYAASRSLIRWKEEKRDEVMPSFFWMGSVEARRAALLRDWTAALERFLHKAIERSAPDSRIHRLAQEHLARLWLAHDDVHPELLPLLHALTPNADSDTAALVESGARKVLDTVGLNAAQLLRISEYEAAEKLVKALSPYVAIVPWLHLLNAEMQPAETARNSYARLLAAQRPKRLPKDLLTTVERVYQTSRAIQIPCRICEKMMSKPETRCPFCGETLTKRELLLDRFPIEREHAVLLARVALAELLVDTDRPAAVDHLNQVIDALAREHAAMPALEAFRERLVVRDARAEHPAWTVADQIKVEGATPGVLYRLLRLNDHQPDIWRELPIATRLMMCRRLIEGGQLKAAQMVVGALFRDDGHLTSVRRLVKRIDGEIEQQITDALDEAKMALALGNAENAIHIVSAAIDLRPVPDLLLLRGKARMIAGHDAAALEDLYRVLATVHDPTMLQEARKGVAALLERRWDLSGALDVLRGAAQDSDVKQAQARVERRKRGEPYIHIERVEEQVYEDTLTREMCEPYYHGFFAVAVREVGRPHTQQPGWVERLLGANFEFVQVLGAFRDLVMDAVFGLRLICYPHPQIAERGQIQIALMTRVSGDSPEACHERAVRLWTDLRGVLPLAHESIYIFEPVVDEDELDHLMRPFEQPQIAEIVRREAHPETDGVYWIAPFAPGTMDLHNLMWTLLRQPGPSMLSLHLRPTHLYAWERSAALAAAAPTMPITAPDQSVSPNGTIIPQMMLHQDQLQRTHNSLWQMNYLRYAYIMRVHIAGSGTASTLLPEMAAASYVGPLRDRGEIGGYEVVRPGNADDHAAALRNLTLLDVEAWGYTAAPDNLRRLRYLMNEWEAAHLFRLPVPTTGAVPGVRTQESKPVAPPSGLPENGVVLGVSTARTGSAVPARITQAREDRRRHTYIVGKTGMGKSTLLSTLVLQDIDAGYGVFLLDPHGDLVEDVLARIPDHRADDVILIDPSDEERPIGLNILNAETEADRHRITNDFLGMLSRLYDPYNQGIVGPIFQQYVRNAMLAALCLEGGTLIDVYRILSDSNYVKRILPRITDPVVKNFWEDTASRSENYSAQYKAELLPYLLSKFSRFVEDTILRRMLGQPRTSVNWRDAMEEQKILLVNLAKGRIGQETAQFLGLLILGDVLQAAFQRSKLPPARRKDFYIYIDEVQNYSTPLLGTMISEGRKFGIALVIANQFLHQLDKGILEAVFGNVGSIVSFRVGVQDANALAPEFYPTYLGEDLIDLAQYTACVKLLVNGVAARPFTMRTLLPSRVPDLALAERIRHLSRLRYGTDIATVERAIRSQF